MMTLFLNEPLVISLQMMIPAKMGTMMPTLVVKLKLDVTDVWNVMYVASTSDDAM